MPIAAGARLGPYEVVTLIGAGGMGEVYKARDTRLNRIVALKVLPSHYQTDPDRRRRLEREAQAVAALAHPHICVLHDVGHHDGIDFLVMEFVDGETLASRVRRGPLPVDQALRSATEIADALDKAHGQGIIHRDLKPGNIMLTRSGVKLLDFGLARFQPAVSTPISTATDSFSAPGTVSGTLPYMAPEQFGGASGDQRTDLFAFGAVLYEMLSGKRAFSGDSPSAVITAILNRHPEPLASIQPTVSRGLDRLVNKCLAKDPEDRWQSASDVADELRWIAGGEGWRAASPGGSRLHRRGRWGLATIAVLLGVVGIVLWQAAGSLRSSKSGVVHRQLTFAGDVITSALSPDGRAVAYSAGVLGGDDQVFVRDLDGGQTSSVWSGKDIGALAWLPDGVRLVVVESQNDGAVWIVSMLGGPARRVAEFGKSVASSPDGTALALSTDDGFHIVSLAGGPARVVSMSGFRWVRAIDWHRRTNRVVLMTVDDEWKVWTVWSVGLDGRDPSRLHTGSNVVRAICSSPVSDVVYVMVQQHGSMDLLRVPIYADPAAAKVLVTDLPVTMMAYRCTVSADGRRLLYGKRSGLANLWRLNFTNSTTQATPLTHGMRDVVFPAVSPDGRWIAATAGSEFASELVKIPIGGGELAYLGEGAGPAWSHDGQRLAFTSRRTGSLRVWTSGPDGQRQTEVPDSAVGGPRPIWLSDGRLAWLTPDRRNYRIRDLLTGHDEYLFVDTAALVPVSAATFSPDGDQLALSRSEYPSALWVVSWPSRTGLRVAPGLWPIGWSANGEWVYAIQSDKGSIVRFSSRLGNTEVIGAPPSGLRVHTCDRVPKDDAMVCSLGKQETDAWMMSNFDRDIF